MQQNQDNRQQQGGTGSAEHSGSTREEQKQNRNNLTEQEQSDIASQIGVKPDAVTTITDLGGLSGRDDASGGSGDRMENQDTNQETEKF